MSKISIPNITSGYASTTAVNNAFDSIETELNSKVLYRDNPSGEPNQMENDIDMNGYAVINASNVEINGINLENIVEDVQEANDILNASLDTVLEAADSASASASEAEESAAIVADWSYENAWTTTTVYKKNNLVTEAGSSYICLVDHTSGTFSTDLTADKWQLFAQKGSAGAGTGDMLAANNLSDLVDPATSRANLGLGSLSTQNADNVDITGGSISGLTGIALDGLSGVLIGNDELDVTAVAPGTSGNILTSNGTTWTSAAPASTSSRVLLGTLTTTSGATQVLSGLDLTDYTSLKVVIDRVSHNYAAAQAAIRLEALAMSINITNTSFLYGTIDIDLELNGVFAATLASSLISGTSTAIGASIRAGESGITTATTSLTFDWHVGAVASFDGGTIKVYGIK